MTVEELHELLWARLEAIAGAAFTPYDGYVPSTPATNYAVLWMSAGTPQSSRVGYKSTDRADRFQITVASGNSQRSCLATVGLIRAEFTDSKVGDLDDPNAPRLKEDQGPGPFPPDTQIPGDQRWWMPMPYRLATSI